MKTQSQHQLPKVVLRALEPEDLDVLYKIENDVELWDCGTTNVPYSRFMLHDYIARATGDIYADRQVRLMIENGEGQVVGIVDVVNFDPRHQRAEVSIVIQRAFRHQGYAQSALAHVVDYSRQVLHLHQLYAFVSADNEASLQMFVRCGFESTSVLSEWLLDGSDYHDAVVMQKKI